MVRTSRILAGFVPSSAPDSRGTQQTNNCGMNNGLGGNDAGLAVPVHQAGSLRAHQRFRGGKYPRSDAGRRKRSTGIVNQPYEAQACHGDAGAAQPGQPEEGSGARQTQQARIGDPFRQ